MNFQVRSDKFFLCLLTSYVIEIDVRFDKGIIRFQTLFIFIQEGIASFIEYRHKLCIQ